MTDAVKSARGRRNRRNGNGAERELVRFLKAQGIDAVTTRNAGGGTQSQRGDIFLPDAPHVVIEVKNTAVTSVAKWLDKLDAECGLLPSSTNSGDYRPLLAWRPPKTPDPGRWVWIMDGFFDNVPHWDASQLTTEPMICCAGAIRLGHRAVANVNNGWGEWCVTSHHLPLSMIRREIR